MVWWPYTYLLGFYKKKPALDWSRNRDAKPVPTSSLAKNIAIGAGETLGISGTERRTQYLSVH